MFSMFTSARENATIFAGAFSPRFCSSRLLLRCQSLKLLQPKGTQMNGRFLINRGDAKVMGVAAGLADYTGVDPTIVRLGFVA